MKDITIRFIEVYNYLLEVGKVSNASDFAKKIEISTSLMNEILKGKSNVGIKPIQKTVNVFDWISLDWLIQGKGKMSEKFSFPNKPSVIKNADEEYAISHFGIPLITIDAMAGFGEGSLQVMQYDTEKYIVPEFTELNVDFMIRVKGSSMYPKYNSGDLVACKKLSIKDLFFQWNKVYVLDTEQGALIKRIKKSDTDNCIKIVSDNPSYDPFDMPLDKIYAISLVVGVIRLE